jgi:hypothetical protein
VRWLDRSRTPERHAYLAVAVRHIVLAVELETLGPVEEISPLAPLASAPPPHD